MYIMVKGPGKLLSLGISKNSGVCPCCMPNFKKTICVVIGDDGT